MSRGVSVSMFELVTFCHRAQLFLWCSKLVSSVQAMENDIYGVDQRTGPFLPYACPWMEFVVGWARFDLSKPSQSKGLTVRCVLKNLG